jgi:hypothetical protein
MSDQKGAERYRFLQVLKQPLLWWICKYFVRIQIRGFGFGSYVDIFAAIEKKCCPKYY